MTTKSEWIKDDRLYKMGKAALKCYEDLVDQRGQEAADEIRDRAIAFMPDVRRDYEASPGLKRFDVIVEGMLLALGVPQGDVPALAATYRSRADASADLSRYGRPITRGQVSCDVRVYLRRCNQQHR